jgi:hypothetical protein
MRYERKKELSALLSVLSVFVTLGLGFISNILATSDALNALLESHFLTIIAGIAVVLAAGGAYQSIMLSRHLTLKREKQRIFLIYAKEDLDAARKLTDELKERGFHIWLDVEEIVPGQIWRKAILKALEESRAALVLVSQNLEKKGFVQEELKVALETLQENEKDVSPVVPVLLGNAPVPDVLSHIQAVNLSEPGGIERLEEGLKRIVAA